MTVIATTAIMTVATGATEGIGVVIVGIGAIVATGVVITATANDDRLDLHKAITSGIGRGMA
ncbi:hypothetical protein RP75_11015 [Agrobacterium arsenijevicii]|uniref:Uncharacterized protein n=1 Tax=Agrobacterium arsenijevicii TaxID=1585697 RepID=A0ABR5D8F2_9HYPH|nr:hypothetical protein RP75_11015 [Agrobacterium arsenijevicii]